MYCNCIFCTSFCVFVFLHNWCDFRNRLFRMGLNSVHYFTHVTPFTCYLLLSSFFLLIDLSFEIFTIFVMILFQNWRFLPKPFMKDQYLNMWDEVITSWSIKEFKALILSSAFSSDSDSRRKRADQIWAGAVVAGHLFSHQPFSRPLYMGRSPTSSPDPSLIKCCSHYHWSTLLRYCCALPIYISTAPIITAGGDSILGTATLALLLFLPFANILSF